MIAAVILAAGGSSRLGQPKALVTRGGQTLLARTIDAALGAGCAPVRVVLGADERRIRPMLEGFAVEVVVNPDWRNGMAGSIRRGVEGLAADEEIEAVVLLTCDQPRIEPAVVAGLIERFDGRPRRRVASEYDGVLGVPALFGRGLFDPLSALAGDRGARAVLLAEPDWLARVPWSGGAVDVDTPADL